MEWRPYIEEQLEWAYRATYGLLDLVGDDDLDWKPETGSNWFTVGQLIRHLADCGGGTFRGLTEEDWSAMPPEIADGGPESVQPPAESWPSVGTVDEARELIRADQAAAFEILAGLTDEDLESRPSRIWWDPREIMMGQRLAEMISHLNQHKGQLFYYLKLMGRDVNSSHLWAM